MLIVDLTLICDYIRSGSAVRSTFNCLVSEKVGTHLKFG